MKTYYIAIAENRHHLRFEKCRAKSLAGAKRAAARKVRFQGEYATIATDENGGDVLSYQDPGIGGFGGFSKGMWVDCFYQA